MNTVVPTLPLEDYLRRLPGRCPSCGFHLRTQGCRCASTSTSTEWDIFVAALREAATNGVVHQAAVRPIIRGRIAPPHIGQCYSRAKREGLLVEIGHDESDDRVGKNAGRLEPRYALGRAA